MTIDEVIQHFGNLHKACIALNIAGQNLTKWKAQGYIPYLQQYRLAELTEGELMPDLIDPVLIHGARKKAQQSSAQS